MFFSRNSTPRFAWRTIKIGIHKDIQSIQAMLSKFRVSSWAYNIIESPKFIPSQEEKTVRLCAATVKEVTGREEATWAEVFLAVKHMGHLCPPEVGPALREQYHDQSNGKRLIVVMEPIRSYGREAVVFEVSRLSDELCLSTQPANPWSLMRGDSRLVFCAR